MTTLVTLTSYALLIVYNAQAISSLTRKTCKKKEEPVKITCVYELINKFGSQSLRTFYVTQSFRKAWSLKEYKETPILKIILTYNTWKSLKPFFVLLKIELSMGTTQSSWIPFFYQILRCGWRSSDLGWAFTYLRSWRFWAVFRGLL